MRIKVAAGLLLFLAVAGTAWVVVCRWGAPGGAGDTQHLAANRSPAATTRVPATESPMFRGILNGFTIGRTRPEPTAFDVCPGTGLDSPRPDELLVTVTSAGPLQVDPAALPAGLSSLDGPYAFQCGGELVQVFWNFHAEAGTRDVIVGGGSVSILRMRGLDEITYDAPGELWAPGTVNGNPAVVSGPAAWSADKPFGSCFVAVHEAKTDIMTTVTASPADVPFCLAVAEGVVR